MFFWGGGGGAMAGGGGTEGFHPGELQTDWWSQTRGWPAGPSRGLELGPAHVEAALTALSPPDSLSGCARAFAPTAAARMTARATKRKRAMACNERTGRENGADDVFPEHCACVLYASMHYARSIGGGKRPSVAACWTAWCICLAALDVSLAHTFYHTCTALWAA